ncbi:hypothetical protein [Mycobacterium sp. 1164966.3]|uniref:hypothetical protein n=1 Tax=Mycobacterium sp. 1164966.3 TaxID=1856861 RepID=UPI0012E7DBFB|nr:hypothetical protein [Mycobacterium sp. 1164966.3]
MQYAPVIVFFLIILTPLLPALVHGARSGYERFPVLGHRHRGAGELPPEASVRR